MSNIDSYTNNNNINSSTNDVPTGAGGEVLTTSPTSRFSKMRQKYKQIQSPVGNYIKSKVKQEVTEGAHTRERCGYLSSAHETDDDRESALDSEKATRIQPTLTGSGISSSYWGMTGPVIGTNAYIPRPRGRSSKLSDA